MTCCAKCGVIRDISGGAMHNVANIWRDLKCVVMHNVANISGAV